MDGHPHSEDEDSMESDIPQQPATTTGLSRDKSLFDDWVRDQRADAYKSARESDVGNESTLVARLSLRDAKDAPIISSPREYQTELFERAKEKNIIAVLDTGWFFT